MSEASAVGRTRTIAAVVVGAVVLAAALFAGAGGAQAGAAITQPPQPKHGPGGSDYSHADWRVSSGGTGADAWYVFEPVKPRPKKAPVTVVMHGYYEFAGYDQLYGFIRHTVRKGSIVIYPRWQTDVATPCPGPFDVEPCIASAVNGIRGALDYLRADRKRVQPQLRKTSYFGFSFGGIVTANMANRYRALGLPKPRAIFLEDPEDSGLAGEGEPALDDSLSGIPRRTLFQCHSGAEGAAADHPDFTTNSCNAVFPLIGQIPDQQQGPGAHPDRHPRRARAVLRPRRMRGGRALRRTQRLRLELLLEGLGRAAKLRARGEVLPLCARRHPPAPLDGQLERRGPDHPARDPGRGADRPLAPR